MPDWNDIAVAAIFILLGAGIGGVTVFFIGMRILDSALTDIFKRIWR